MEIHASCAARDDAGVLLIGPPGSGKSDLVLRLLDRGFTLVADDRVEMENGIARPSAALAGLLEVRGVGIVKLSHLPAARIALVVQLGSGQGSRLPEPRKHADLGVPVIDLDPWAPSAPARVAIALDCATGRMCQVAGAFSP